MSDLFSVNFQYHDQSYSALARLKEIEGKPAFTVTIMNGDLEKILYGNHSFFIIRGEVDGSSEVSSKEIRDLRISLARALTQKTTDRRRQTAEQF